MSDSGAPRERLRRTFLLVLTLAISVLFVAVIRGFLMAVLLAAIFSGMAHPFYKRMLRRLGDRRASASVATILILLVAVGLPILGFLAVVAGQALEVTAAVGPWIEKQVGNPLALTALLDRIPLLDYFPALRNLVPDSDRIMARTAQAASGIGAFLLRAVPGATRGTLVFALQLFVMLYAMFFFLVDGGSVLERILYYIPMSAEDKQRLLERFGSVTRATLKGSILVGAVQGLLAGLGFLVAGVPGAAVWGTVMIVLSIIPLVGAGLIWLPAVFYLLAVGSAVAALGLFIWCAAVVSTVDNVLRPRLIGRDTRMPDLLVLLSTLGGIALFGVAGVVVGPIVAALFVTVWHLYGKAFEGWLSDAVPLKG